MFDFEHIQDGAWSVWTGRVHLGTLLRDGARWEAFTMDGKLVVDTDRRARRFRSREAAASALATLRRE